MNMDQGMQLMMQGIMLKHPHCKGHLMMEGGSIKLHRIDGRMCNIGNPVDAAHILSNIMSDDWDIVGLEDVKAHKENYDKLNNTQKE